MGSLKNIKKLGSFRAHSAAAGFTVLELLVVMMMSGAALGLLLPAVTDLNRPYIKTNALAKFMADLGRAQSHAITVGCQVDLTLSENGYTYHCSYATNNAVCPDNHSQACRIFTETLDKKIQIEPVPALNTVWYFNSRGLLVNEEGTLVEADIEFRYLRKGTDDTFDAYADAEVLTTGVVSYIMS
jgi:type II secretory pathway pseudopilin PulG